MIILAVDPSVSHLGWGAIQVKPNNSAQYLASGTIYNKPSMTLSVKLAKIFTKLDELIKIHNVTLLVTENVYLDKDLMATLSLSYARAIVIALAGLHNMELYEVHSSNVKKVITGSGRASKDQVKYMIETLLPPAKTDSHDESDALAMAYAAFIHKTTSNRLFEAAGS
jgi:crossover junction endodeoxyribonuclease RuvC